MFLKGKHCPYREVGRGERLLPLPDRSFPTSSAVWVWRAGVKFQTLYKSGPWLESWAAQLLLQDQLKCNKWVLSHRKHQGNKAAVISSVAVVKCSNSNLCPLSLFFSTPCPDFEISASPITRMVMFSVLQPLFSSFLHASQQTKLCFSMFEWWNTWRWPRGLVRRESVCGTDLRPKLATKQTAVCMI